MPRYAWLVVIVLLTLSSCWPSAETASPPGKTLPTQKPKSKRQLTRSDGHRWDRLAEIVKGEIKSAARKFLDDRDQALVIPLEIDLLMLGFDEDGGYHYSLGPRELEDVLSGMHAQRDICPTIWETGEPASVCFNVNYVTLTPPENSLEEVERGIMAAMRHQGNRTYDYLGDGQWGEKHPEEVYEVTADGHLEDTLYNVLIKAYQEDSVPLPVGLRDSQELASHRMAIIILNPHKPRMSPLVDWKTQEQYAQWHRNIVDGWKDGHVNKQDLLHHEAGYSYRYSYLGRGAAAAWVSRHNFIVIDLSAGPVAFGPQTTPDGEMEPAAMPRILPMLLRMSAELEQTNQIGTLWTHVIQQAEEGTHMLLLGKIAAVVASATRHLFCPDIQFERVEHAKNVLVPLIALYDAEDADPLASTTTAYRQIALGHVQMALNQLLDNGQEGFVEPRSKPLQAFPAIAAAINKARVSRSDAVLMKEPDVGLHKSHKEHVDGDILLQELLMAIPELSDGSLAVIDDEDKWGSQWQSLADHARHQGTRVLPVFVLTLTGAPEQMMLSNKQLVAATHDAVVVLQLVKEEDDQSSSDEGHVRSGHVVDGQPLHIDAAGGVSSNVVAGLAMALTGLVPSYERHDPWEGRVVQDWRWSVGALPWAPYAHSTQLSGVLVAAAKRNFIVSHIEVVVRAVQSRLAKMDALVAERLSNPFAYLFDPNIYSIKELNEPAREFGEKLKGPNPHLNSLIGMSTKSGYNQTFPATTLEHMQRNLATVQDKLQQISWDLWASAWSDAQGNLVQLMAAADLFIKHADRDLEAAQDAAACCALASSSNEEIHSLIIIVCVIFFVALVCIIGTVFIQTPSRPPARPQQRSGTGGYMDASPFEQRSKGLGYYPSSQDNLGSNSSLQRAGSGSTPVSRKNSDGIGRQLSNTLMGAVRAMSFGKGGKQSLPMFEKKKDSKFSV